MQALLATGVWVLIYRWSPFSRAEKFLLLLGYFLFFEYFVISRSYTLAALLGWLLAEMLVAMLQHVFDPPPDHLAAPWPFLGALAGAAVAGAAVAAVLAAVWIRRLPLGAILREE